MWPAVLFGRMSLSAGSEMKSSRMNLTNPASYKNGGSALPEKGKQYANC